VFDLEPGVDGALAGLECPFVVRAPNELKEALERRAEEISALARRTEQTCS
jgi:hypothetical protein